MPEKCEKRDCYSIGIHEGNCGTLENLEGKYDTSGHRIWRAGKTGCTNKNCRAAGTRFDLECVYDYDDNKFEAMVIYGPEDNMKEAIKATGCGMLVPGLSCKLGGCWMISLNIHNNS